MAFELICAAMIALLFGLAMCCAGYRLFLVLLPIWGFFFGFGLGAQTLQALFGEGFMSTVTSWVVGFVVGALFAVLSYLFYMVAVAIIAGSLGYALGVGLLEGIGMDFGLLVWIVGIVAAIALIGVTFYFNLQKWVIIIATAALGAGAIVGTFLWVFGKVDQSVLAKNPVAHAIQSSPLALLAFIALVVVGIVAQHRASQSYVLETYSRYP